ncbi:origin of replication binding protein-domain-containing protein [Blyttiomyces helicus]|uniref:Origin of replication binding protein-domain-containing protein n=1 Tax=Blyttiomyces helicus TaxID=388810 RepID=A0A4P9WDY4_9FUNG|nr:origin of replication binding protein-domain-containing protein [Blyttiomyces helicus]|eukprot:RKO89965.1 origin of replication binding protein-domain-containing protein [Blyttiomyces helicus]
MFLDHVRDQYERDEKACNLYEIIFKDQKSCFYLDIDVKDLDLKDDHRELSSELLIPNMKQKLYVFFDYLHLDVMNENVLVLESSNEVKTSFPVVIRGAWIKENAAVRYQLNCLFIKWLSVHKKEDKIDVVSYLDASVYSSLQNFRTIYSTKWKRGDDQRYLMPYLCYAPDIFYFVTFIDEQEGINNRIIGMEDLPELKNANLKKTVKLAKQKQKLDKVLKNTSAIDRQLIVEGMKNFYQHEIVAQTHDESIKFYVKCIPNGNKHADFIMKDVCSDDDGQLQVGQPWFVWWGIGAAIHRVIRKSQSTEHSEGNNDLNRIGFNIFAEWSSNSPKSKEWMVTKTWEDYGKCYREVGFDLSTLKRLTKLSNPGLFDFNYDVVESFEPYESFIDKYVGTPWVKPYSPHNQLFEKSPMGTGKSFAVAQRIISSKPSRVICLSPRQSFAANFVGNLNANLEGHLNESGIPIHFQNYSELLKKDDFTNWWRHNYLVIQMESLWKIDNDHFRPYDLLVCDEIESNLKTFASSTMLTPIRKYWAKSRLDENLKTFEKLLKTSKQCIYMDAFLSRRTLDVINSITN